MKKLKILSLFDGISGARQALKELNIDCEYYASEIDRYAIQVAKNNHPDIIHIGDVKDVDFTKFKDVELLVAGFPCQSWSKAGLQKGIDDERGNLFFQCVKALEIIKPKFFLFENVKMKQDFQDFINDKIKTKPILINSDRFVQQNRERLYWTNIRINNLPDRPNWQGEYYQWRRTYFRKNKSGVCPTLTANMGTGGHNVPLKSENLQDKLSVNEVARLQGFPDNYHAGISNTQAYKCYGNSFTVPIIKHILNNITK